MSSGRLTSYIMNKSIALRLATAALAVVGLIGLSSCTTAEVKDVWTAPDLTNIKFKKVLVIAATQEGKDGVSRRTAEDAIAQALPNVQAVPSYAFITENDLNDATKISASIKSAGFDGIIVLRMVSERTEVNAYSTGYPGYYGSFGGYYGRYGYGGMSMGTTVTTDRIISIETNIYEFPAEKLIWSGSVESTSPGNIKQMVDDTVGAVRQYMVKQKLIAAPAK
jgi:hypothetical protein